MTDSEIVASTVQSTINVGAVDMDGKVSIVTFEGHFRFRDVEITIRGDKMNFSSFIRGLEE